MTPWRAKGETKEGAGGVDGTVAAHDGEERSRRGIKMGGPRRRRQLEGDARPTWLAYWFN